jgi:hypothetical protein
MEVLYLSSLKAQSLVTVMVDCKIKELEDEGSELAL